MRESVPDYPPARLPLWRLRENLIDLTAALADELVADGDYARLEALAALYLTTKNALQRRELRAVQ